MIDGGWYRFESGLFLMGGGIDLDLGLGLCSGLDLDIIYTCIFVYLYR